jgi:hypothetical protein
MRIAADVGRARPQPARRGEGAPLSTSMSKSKIKKTE